MVEAVFKMGDPYYCSECGRDHVKGKIYKSHVKYAQNGDSEEEEDLGEDNKGYDEEKEILDAFDDLGIEVDEESTFDEAIILDDEDNEEDRKASADESVQKVKKLPGVGEATLSKLIKAGFNSLESIAYTPPKLIREDSGLGEKTVAKLVKSSMEQLDIGFKSGEEIWNIRKNIARIETGCQELDAIFGGGFECGTIIELYGEFRTGKTQICHQLSVNVQLPKEQGGLEGRALYIDTEGTFRPERIINMAEALNLDYTQVLKSIIYGRAFNSDHQILLIKEAANIIKEKNIKLIIVDSLIGHFRSEYIGRGTLANRQQLINTHLHDLMRLCDIHSDLAVIVTNQVSSKPDVFYGNPTTHTGGHIVAHGSGIRVYLRKGKGEQRVAKIVDAPHLPESEAVFTITQDGIKDA